MGCLTHTRTHTYTQLTLKHVLQFLQMVLRSFCQLSTNDEAFFSSLSPQAEDYSSQCEWGGYILQLEAA